MSLACLPGQLGAAKLFVELSLWSSRGTLTIKYRGAGKVRLPASSDILFGPLNSDVIDEFLGPQKAGAVGDLNLFNYAVLLQSNGREAQIRGPFGTSRSGKVKKMLASPLSASLERLPGELKALMRDSMETIASLNPATTVVEVQDIKVKAKPKANDTIRNKLKITVILTDQAQAEMKPVNAQLSYTGAGERVF